MNNGIFIGQDGLKNFLDPHNHPDIPLVELPAQLNPYYEYGVRIYAKLMNYLPLGNVKSVPAFGLLQSKGDGSHKKLVEASSGNTVFSLGIMSQYMNYNSVTALVSREVSKGKLKLLRLANVIVEVVDEPICPDPGNPTGAIWQAKKRHNLNDEINLGQYDNMANPGSHYDYTGPQIFRQLSGKVDVFAAGLGTTGTLVGVGSYLRGQNERIHIIGVTRMPNNSVPGVRTRNLLKEVQFEWGNLVDNAIDITQIESYEMSLKMIRLGLLVGPSSGFALAGLYKGIDNLIKNNKIDKNSITNAVFICPDGPLAYIDDYFNVLDESYFPEIKNRELLYSEYTSREDSYKESNEVVITIDDLKKNYITIIDNKIHINKGTAFIDVREAWEYMDHHIDQSINIPLQQILDDSVVLPQASTYILICRSGSRSLKAAHHLKEKDKRVYSLAGGTTEWSAQGLPRIKAAKC